VGGQQDPPSGGYDRVPADGHLDTECARHQNALTERYSAIGIVASGTSPVIPSGGYGRHAAPTSTRAAPAPDAHEVEMAAGARAAPAAGSSAAHRWSHASARPKSGVV